MIFTKNGFKFYNKKKYLSLFLLSVFNKHIVKNNILKKHFNCFKTLKLL